MRASSRFLPVLLLAAAATGQSFTLPLNPRATYLRTNNDSPLPPLVFDLAAANAGAGTWLRIGTAGGYRYVNGGADDHRSLCGVFSAGTTLLASNVQQRVPGAIAAGPAFPSGGTFYGNLPMDVPQDFYCSRRSWADAITVEVPAGATHLFLGVYDSWYSDNVDPNGDYAAIVTIVPAPALPGTGEHLELASAIAGAPATSPSQHATPPGATMTAQLRHPLGFADGSLYVFVADTMPTGGQVPQLLPRLWLANLVVVQFGVLPNTPGWTDTFSLVAPSGLAGGTLLIQAGALTPLSRNGLYQSTDAHRFALQ